MLHVKAEEDARERRIEYFRQCLDTLIIVPAGPGTPNLDLLADIA